MKEKSTRKLQSECRQNQLQKNYISFLLIRTHLRIFAKDKFPETLKESHILVLRTFFGDTETRRKGDGLDNFKVYLNHFVVELTIKVHSSNLCT